MNAFLDLFYFILRYIPFWSIPVMMISAQFAYNYWLKDLRRTSLYFAILFTLSLLFLVFYIYAGSPDRSVQLFQSLSGVNKL